MSKRQQPKLGTLPRRTVSLLTALTFLVLAVTGIVAFIQPFSIGIIGLHSLMGFVFIGLIVLHIANNSRPLGSYLRSKALWGTLAVTSILTVLFWWQPAPVRAVLGLSGNLGPAMERFEMDAEGMAFDYSPSPAYKMRLNVKPGPTYKADSPPQVAIWLENQGGYHIKTLLAPVSKEETPYWSFKHAGWEKARREAEELGEVDAVSSPTPNGSFDPADYILPNSTKDSTPYSLVLEVNQPGDDQASLVYSVEIDNSLPRTFQLLELRGYPKREEDDKDGKEKWGLYYVDDSFTSALDLIDSVLLTLQRTAPQSTD
ncbi:hypothetical protein OVA24_10540 [Luteolibacter sp. SL250]|uniref:hypothetical protein n=1 Tax=Luteolibacter sp. SL250 TaxID=2995170 RepID=UPI00226F11F8|nr:hypothetical protein [Luteolibacter sp. SL250]WAC21822.1 hypothetical protein OVA24_10540 [Luteolibacter sp. SL250]